MSTPIHTNSPFQVSHNPGPPKLPQFRIWRHLWLGVIAVSLVALFTGSIGSVYIPPVTLIKLVLAKVPIWSISQTWPDSWETIVWQIRFPRVVLTALVGSALAISGATYQGLFRNPLADPYLIGVASGAGLGATIVLLTSIPLYFWGISILPLAAFSGGVLAVSLAYGIASQNEGPPITTLILAGVAIGSMTASVTALLMIRSDPDVKPLLGWLLGGFIGASWQDIVTTLPYLMPGILGMLAYGRVLNLFQLSENEAKQLGVDVSRTKFFLIAFATLTTAAAVSVSGLIGFVGLIAPHSARLIWGSDFRYLLPHSMFLGATFLLLADMVARTALNPHELPVGVVTAFCGAPFFLFLLHRNRRLSA